MTTITEAIYEQVMDALRSSSHPSSIAAAKQLKTAHMESLARAFEFNNEAPAFCRAQAD